jgi:LysM repeat protein
MLVAGSLLFFISLLLALMAAILLGSAPARAQSGGATPAATIAILTATPQPDGSIIHEVAPGQALWSIAQAYGLSIDAISRLNNLATDAVLYAGDKLVVAPSFTPTSSPTITNTLPPPTRTPIPTHTPRPPTLTASLAPTHTATPKVLLPPLEGDTRRSVGIGLIAVCALGILMVIIHALRGR